MKRYIFISAALLICGTSLQAQHAAPERAAVEGRWDLTVTNNGNSFPSWLEVSHSGIKTYVGRFVGGGGSARPIAEVFTEGKSFHFAIPPQWEPQPKYLEVKGECEGDSIWGTMEQPNGTTVNFTGSRAPELPYKENVSWGKPEKLFNGKDLTGWTALGKNQWVVEDGVLKSPHSGANIRTNETFNDFKLHVEFRYPEGSNSGVYLRGRYEVQVEDDKGNAPFPGGFGAVYGFLTPYVMAAKSAGEWQSYDITLIGRRVTVVANGILIINDQVIPGITGGALDSKEGEPGPIFFQGDHGPIEYRNIVLTRGK